MYGRGSTLLLLHDTLYFVALKDKYVILRAAFPIELARTAPPPGALGEPPEECRKPKYYSESRRVAPVCESCKPAPLLRPACVFCT